MTDNPITLAGDLGKPADTLIKKISAATGAIFEPAQIKRIAKAEATAEVIRAEARVEVQKIEAQGAIEIQDVRQRAAMRWIAAETKKQENIEAITSKTIPMLNPAAEPDNLDNDWIAHFFDKSQLVSDEQMQNLWAKILAGEANEPGSYSKRVVAAVSTLSKPEAESFNTLCSFAWTIQNQLVPLIYDIRSDICQSHGLTLVSLTELDAIGLLSLDTTGGFMISDLPKEITASYHGDSVRLLIGPQQETGYVIEIGSVILTQVGRELATVCNPKPIDGFKDYVLDHWKRHGYSIVGDDEDTTTD